jgi:acyl-CoA thioester hydrolase
VRIYYEDTDSAGLVYHANYLRFMERARTEWLRVLGFEQKSLSENFGIVFVVSKCEVRFLRPAMLDCELTIRTKLARKRRTNFELDQTISNQRGELVCSAANVVACVDSKKFSLKRIPFEIQEAIYSGNRSFDS